MTYRILSIAIMLGIGINASAQHTDPALVGAVGVQTAMLKDIFSDREKTQQKIIAAEAAVTVAMDRMHQVENKMLDYLSNAQGAMQNLYQIKRAAELVTTEIPQNMNLVRKSVPGHLKGTAIALLVSDELTDAATQMASLFPFMKQLVTSGTYNVDGYDSQGNPTTEKHKVNLLNSAERYYVANEVVSKLETINTDLWLLAWQIRTLSWQDLWYGLDPEGWAAVMSGKAIVESLIYEWEYL
jgi:predicted ribonuclease YlaK